jgi:hypothetical protein
VGCSPPSVPLGNRRFRFQKRTAPQTDAFNGDLETTIDLWMNSFALAEVWLAERISDTRYRRIDGDGIGLVLRSMRCALAGICRRYLRARTTPDGMCSPFRYGCERLSGPGFPSGERGQTATRSTCGGQTSSGDGTPPRGKRRRRRSAPIELRFRTAFSALKR